MASLILEDALKYNYATICTLVHLFERNWNRMLSEYLVFHVKTTPRNPNKLFNIRTLASICGLKLIVEHDAERSRPRFHGITQFNHGHNHYMVHVLRTQESTLDPVKDLDLPDRYLVPDFSFKN